MPSSSDRTHALPEGTPGYETQDASARGVLWFLGILGAVVVLVVLLCFGVFHLYERIYAPPAPASPFAQQRQIPAGPNLQVNAVEDFDHYRQREQQQLDTYGWVDRQNGVVRIPIDRAMDLLLQKGLPVAPLPSESSSLQTQPPADRKGSAP